MELAILTLVSADQAHVVNFVILPLIIPLAILHLLQARGKHFQDTLESSKLLIENNSLGSVFEPLLDSDSVNEGCVTSFVGEVDENECNEG